MWYRSLYWRIGFGFVALMATLLGAQGLLLLWLTGQGGWLPGRSPRDLGRTIASDVATALAADPAMDIGQHVRERYGRMYRPFVIVLADGRIITGRDVPPPSGMVRAARARLRGWDPGGRPAAEPPPGRGPGRRPPAPGDELSPVVVEGRLLGVVVVATRGPQWWFL
ncbi:MAG TPA: hypothetical protein VK911_09365, partial [Vicinamibacterales bacterium]|nr:hypothetical protein [Vicinamibacterales bacterium]